MSPISSTDSTTRATSSTDEGGVSALGTRRGRRPVETPTGGPISNVCVLYPPIYLAHFSQLLWEPVDHVHPRGCVSNWPIRGGVCRIAWLSVHTDSGKSPPLMS